MNKKILGVLIAFGLLASPLYAEKVKVGFMTTLSGPAGIIGKQMKHAFQLGLGSIPIEAESRARALGGISSHHIPEALARRNHE